MPEWSEGELLNIIIIITINGELILNCGDIIYFDSVYIMTCV